MRKIKLILDKTKKNKVTTENSILIKFDPYSDKSVDTAVDSLIRNFRIHIEDIREYGEETGIMHEP